MASRVHDAEVEHGAPERPSWLAAAEFFFGPPPSRLELVRGELVSVWELFRARRAEARPADEDEDEEDEGEPTLPLAVARLAAFLAVAIALAGFLVVGLGSMAVRAALGYVG